MKRIINILAVLSLLCVLFSILSGCAIEPQSSSSISLDSIPEFDGKTPYVSINGGVPSFTDDDMVTTSYEKYAKLDSLGRCGVTIACIGKDIMPTEDRGSIGSVKPTGWHTVKYDIVDGKYLYNRCHLIGYQLTGENANKENLITGTRYMNVDGMLPFENMVADYVKETDNHVMYRVTPIFEGTNLVANGVLIEAKSVEDNGEGIEFCVFVYNNQPGIIIDYRNGNSKLDDGTKFPEQDSDDAEDNTTEENPEKP
ncbi:MAG: DNA/RNA non-specific endonuclease, partial [Clostridia bacterium]|nr:DNA/RNA non-specific endonuclease [Clostridia bacterium]